MATQPAHRKWPPPSIGRCGNSLPRELQGSPVDLLHHNWATVGLQQYIGGHPLPQTFAQTALKLQSAGQSLQARHRERLDNAS